MITAKVENVHVEIKAAGTAEELAGDVLRIIKGLYDDLVEADTCMKINAAAFRSTIMLLIEDVLDYEKLGGETDEPN